MVVRTEARFLSAAGRGYYRRGSAVTVGPDLYSDDFTDSPTERQVPPSSGAQPTLPRRPRHLPSIGLVADGLPSPFPGRVIWRCFIRSARSSISRSRACPYAVALATQGEVSLPGSSLASWSRLDLQAGGAPGMMNGSSARKRRARWRLAWSKPRAPAGRSSTGPARVLTCTNVREAWLRGRAQTDSVGMSARPAAVVTSALSRYFYLRDRRCVSPGGVPFWPVCDHVVTTVKSRTGGWLPHPGPRGHRPAGRPEGYEVAGPTAAPPTNPRSLLQAAAMVSGRVRPGPGSAGFPSRESGGGRQGCVWQ
jgi:hypothetical protein